MMKSDADNVISDANTVDRSEKNYIFKGALNLLFMTHCNDVKCGKLFIRPIVRAVYIGQIFFFKIKKYLGLASKMIFIG